MLRLNSGVPSAPQRRSQSGSHISAPRRGALDASPEVPAIAKTSARALVDLAVGRTAQHS